MIYAQRKETKVILQVSLPVLGGTFPFVFECGNEWSARALDILLSKALAERFTAVRREEYNAGLKDARAKKDDRRDWFDPGLSLGIKK